MGAPSCIHRACRGRGALPRSILGASPRGASLDTEPKPVPSAIRLNGRAFGAASSPVSVGRDPGSNVVIDDELVSRRHALVEHVRDGWMLRDADSRNGVYRDGERVEEVAIVGDVTVRLGDPVRGPELALAVDQEAPAGAATVLAPIPRTEGATGTIRIGRGPENQIDLADDLRVSRRHAELRPLGGGAAELVDLGSRHGTFVNDVPVRRTRLAEGDLVSIGSRVFRFRSGELVEELPHLGAALEAIGLAVDLPDGRRILDEVGFVLRPSSVLGVVGPSGSGKSTLLNALTGFRPADFGAVYYGGRDLYLAYEELRFRIGFVPQEDILHTQLTVRKALEFAAELRFAPDVDATTRRQRIDEVLAEMGLTERADVRISSLSGGQRKRVSVALELLTKPTLLFLDEPTSGLDPGHERELMELLRRLAQGGRIVVVVTHSTQSLDLCDRVLFLAPGGKVAFYGSAPEALDYFGEDAGEGGYASLFRTLETSKDVDWKARYLAHPLHAGYVGRLAEQAERERRQTRPPLPPRARLPWFRQLWVLSRRNVALIRADTRSMALLVLQAPILGALFLALFKTNALSTNKGEQATLLVWLLAVGATWLGAANAIREIVKELPIYRRERAVGLSILSYLGSKALVLGGIVLVQSVLLVAVAVSQQSFPPKDTFGVIPQLAAMGRIEGDFTQGAVIGSQMLELMIAAALAGLGAMALGLLISALVRTSDQALTVLPLVLAAQIVVSLPIAGLAGGFVNIVGHAATAQWGTAAGASTVSLNELRVTTELSTVYGSVDVRERFDQDVDADFVRRAQGSRSRARIGGTTGPKVWLGSALAMALLTIVSLAVAAFVLRRRDLRVLVDSPRARKGRAGPAALARR
ncbi:MAG: ATP-binding cassette domain-containing protein [Thermoleophilia bacterium]